MDLAESFNRVTDHIVNRFKEAIEREKKPNRPTMDVLDENVGVDAVLYFIAPHRLKELDVSFMRRLHTIATIVPIIAKADVYTRDELRDFRELVSRRLHDEGIDIPCEPFAIICAQYPDANDKQIHFVRGREYPWGTALSENEEHSDLPALRKFLLTEGLMELHARRRRFFETYRCNLAVCKQQMTKSILARIMRVPRLAFGFAVRTAVVLMAARLIQKRGQCEGPQQIENGKKKHIFMFGKNTS